MHVIFRVSECLDDHVLHGIRPNVITFGEDTRNDGVLDQGAMASKVMTTIVSAATLNPRRSQVNYPPFGQIQIISGDLYIQRSSKRLPELFRDTMDTPDSFLVSVPAEMFAFR